MTSFKSSISTIEQPAPGPFRALQTAWQSSREDTNRAGGYGVGVLGNPDIDANRLMTGPFANLAMVQAASGLGYYGTLAYTNNQNYYRSFDPGRKFNRASPGVSNIAYNDQGEYENFTPEQMYNRGMYHSLKPSRTVMLQNQGGRGIGQQFIQWDDQW